MMDQVNSTKFKKFDIKFLEDYLPKKFPHDIAINENLNQSINDFHKVSLITYNVYSNLPLKILKLVIIFYFYFKNLIKKNVS